MILLRIDLKDLYKPLAFLRKTNATNTRFRSNEVETLVKLCFLSIYQIKERHKLEYLHTIHLHRHPKLQNHRREEDPLVMLRPINKTSADGKFQFKF